MTAARAITEESGRLDRWLWCARFFKTRTLASRLCAAGKIRVNRMIVTKAHYTLRAGDVLTFAQGDRVRVVKVTGFVPRRVSAAAAAGLYEDMSPPAPPRVAKAPSVAARDKGAGRPTKADRRAVDKLRRGDAD
jgi:ribosome-associated heat shock protein Hsp15